MKYSNIKYFCTVNGNGVRTAVFVSGCRFHCEGCFNQKAWDFDFGKEFTEEVIDKILDSIDYDYIKGLSVLGGEPLDPRNQDGVKHLLERFRERFGNKKDVWLWTGYYKRDFSDEQLSIAKMCDYIVDGPFVLSEYNRELVFRGSENQTIWYFDGIDFNEYVK